MSTRENLEILLSKNHHHHHHQHHPPTAEIQRLTFWFLLQQITVSLFLKGLVTMGP